MEELERKWEELKRRWQELESKWEELEKVGVAYLEREVLGRSLGHL